MQHRNKMGCQYKGHQEQVSNKKRIKLIDRETYEHVANTIAKQHMFVARALEVFQAAAALVTTERSKSCPVLVL